MHYSSLAFLLSSISLEVSAQTLKLAQNYSGSTFFDRWTFQAGIDANTTGNVLFQTREQATGAGLATTNSVGNVIIKVDNTTSGVGNSTFGRPSVKILSNDALGPGSLMILDAVHLPFGCSVWPAFWLEGQNWPDNGEIDLIENVNLATQNQYALHTTQGCQHPPANSTLVSETGSLQQADCFNVTNGNTGCLIREKAANSYGQGFAAAGGGAYAMLWTDEAITIWFFTRSAIPADMLTANPNPASWPTPSAVYPSTSCDFSKYFGPQTIIFDISICGNFAGLPVVFNQTCSGNCLDLVQHPENYNDAYFEIRSLTVFTNSSQGFEASSSATAPGSTQSGNPGGGGSGAVSLFSTATLVWATVVGFAIPVGVWCLFS